MTKDKDFKDVVRERAAKTGESYSAARSNLTAEEPVAAGSSLAFIRDQLVAALDGYWKEFRPTLKGLTDDEYLWEPVPGCPNIRKGPDGKYQAQPQFPVRGAATIAQRICWVAQLMLVRTNQHFGDKSVIWANLAEVPSTATGGVAFLERGVTAWLEGLAAVDPERLLVPSENRSPGAIDHMYPFIGTVEHSFQLLVQCSSHATMVRDLYVAAHPEMVP